MARNVIAVCEAVIRMILSTFFVEVVKITPFSGSIFFKGSKPFLTGTSTRYHFLSTPDDIGVLVILNFSIILKATTGYPKYGLFHPELAFRGNT